MANFTRRESLTLAGALAASAALPVVALADMTGTKAEAAELTKKFAAGKLPIKGSINLTLPEIAENGGIVPMTVSVGSPMTEASHVAEVLILAEANPYATIAKLTFTPMSGKAEATMRIRLAETQKVTVLAKLNDGTVFIEQKLVKVTTGGCG